MTIQLAVAIALHQLATVIWVGGMFFAHFALRTSAQRRLEPPQRLPLLLSVFDRFFRWVWAAVVVLWATGLWIFVGIYSGAMAWHVHVMMALALVMTALFAYIYFVPYRALARSVAAGDWAEGGRRVGVIRQIILVNLGLGVLTAMLGSAGRYI
jgi:uncharacterized membrane protein